MKDKFSFEDLCAHIINNAASSAQRVLDNLVDGLTALNYDFTLANNDKATTDVMIAITALETQVAKNLVNTDGYERICEGVYNWKFDDVELEDYWKQELTNYVSGYNAALDQGANPLSGVSSQLLYRITNDDKDAFTTSDGSLSPLADMTALGILVGTPIVVKIANEKYNLV